MAHQALGAGGAPGPTFPAQRHQQQVALLCGSCVPMGVAVRKACTSQHYSTYVYTNGFRMEMANHNLANFSKPHSVPERSAFSGLFHRNHSFHTVLNTSCVRTRVLGAAIQGG